MPPVAVRIEGLGKRYRIGGQGVAYGTLRDSLAGVARAPLRLFGTSADDTRGGDFWALRDVSFEVQPGEVLGIIGRNGAGKSTLLKILSRVTRPTTGRGAIRGRVGALLEVGTGFHPELSGRENIYLSGAVLGMKRHDLRRNFDDIVDFAGIAPFLDTPVKRYSSGMYMRLAFSVAAHLEPDVLIVDEVLAVGDAAFQKKCLGRMSSVAREGRTVLFVSHNMSAILSLCDRALRLDAGRVVDDGAPAHVVQRYLASAAESVDVPLHARGDRSGDGSMRAVSLRIESADGEPVIRSRSRVKLTIGYRSDAPVRRAQFVVSISDDMDIGLFVLHSEMSGGLPDVLPPEGSVVCCTDRINLVPGRCFVHLELMLANVRADLVLNAASFDVEPDDTYSSGILPTRDWALFLLQQRWFTHGDGRAD